MPSGIQRVVTTLMLRHWPIPGPSALVDALTGYSVGGSMKDVVMVLRHRDMIEVLSRDDDFSVHLYDQKMTETSGPFILGMNEPERHDPELAILKRAVRRGDGARVREIAAAASRRTIEPHLAVGELDLIQHVSEVVPMAVVKGYLGAGDTDPLELLRLFQDMSQHIFTFWVDPKARQRAISAGKTIREILDAEIARRRSQEPDESDVLGRLLAMDDGFDDEGISRTMAGTISGAINAPLGLFTYAMGILLDLPQDGRRELSAAAVRAQGGDEDAHRLVREYVFEAERFVSFPPFVYRRCERDTTIAEGTSREKRVPKGATVVTWPSIAAFDEEVVDSPWTFRPGRPASAYFTLGYGRHHCVGDEVGQAMIVEMVKALFALPGLRRAPGKAGQLKTRSTADGRYPIRFGVCFDAA